MENKREVLSIVIPCYNEEATIELFEKAFLETVSAMFRDIIDRVSFELVFVDDGSTDATLDILRRVCLDRPAEELCSVHFKYISFSRNFGKEAAMYAGLQATTGDMVAVMDVDLQDPPELLREMYDEIHAGRYDCVATRRSTRKGEPRLLSWFSNRFYDVVNMASEVEIVNGARDFRLMSRQMVNAVLSLCEHHRFSKGLFAWVGFKVKWLSYENKTRSAGKTKWSFPKFVKYALDGIFGFSETWLQISVAFAVMAFVAWLACLIVSAVLWNLLVFLFAWVAFFFGLLFSALWVIGSYLVKLHAEAVDRPLYVIRETGEEEKG